MMERLIPILWSGATIACVLGMYWIQPWRAAFIAARGRLAEGRWLVPAVAAMLDQLWQAAGEHRPTPSLIHPAALKTGDDLVCALLWPIPGAPAGMLLALAWLSNGGAIKGATIEAMSLAWGEARARWCFLILSGSAVATLGWPLVRYTAGGGVGESVVALMAAPWLGAAVCFFAAWVMMESATARRHSGKIIAPLTPAEAATAAVRLWPLAAAAMVVFPFRDALSSDVRTIFRLAAWPLAVIAAFLPFALVQQKLRVPVERAFTTAAGKLLQGVIPLTGWLLLAVGPVFLLHFTHGWLAARLAPESWLRGGLALLTAALVASVTVWLASAWVTMQVDLAAGPTQNLIKSRRAKAKANAKAKAHTSS